MKYQFAAVTLASFLMTLPVASMRADEPGQGMEPQEHHWDSAKMQKKLGLTDDQTAKMKALHDSEKEAMKPLWEKQKDLMKTLEGQVKAKASDTDIQATLDAMKSNHEAMRSQMEQFQTQKDAILTPTQRAQMMLAHMHHHGHGGKDHPMGQDKGASQ